MEPSADSSPCTITTSPTGSSLTFVLDSEITWVFALVRTVTVSPDRVLRVSVAPSLALMVPIVAPMPSRPGRPGTPLGETGSDGCTPVEDGPSVGKTRLVPAAFDDGSDSLLPSRTPAATPTTAISAITPSASAIHSPVLRLGGGGSPGP